MKIDVMAFAPHPDDVEMGCGGTLIKLKKQGYKTAIVDLTYAELSSNGDLKTRALETEKASGILNLDLRENLGIEDGNIVNSIENRNKIIDVVRKYRPQMVFIPFYKDRHPDHENANKLLRDSLFISGLLKYEREFDFYRPNIVMSYMLHFEFIPSFITDISEEFEEKVKAVTSYKSQFFSSEDKSVITHISTKAFNDILHTRARYYGLKINCTYGEPFFINAKIKINNPLDFFNYIFY